MKKYIWLSCALFLLVGTACNWKNTKDAMKHGEELRSSIDNFEKNRKKLSTSLVASLEEAEKDLTAEDPDLPKVSKDFEKQWTSIQNRYKKLQKDFARVGASSEGYFAKLDELSGAIGNEKLRAEELGKNQVLKGTWDKSYQEANVSIEKITTVLQAGNDFHMVLVASSIRQKLEQNVGELNLIAEQAKALLGDLEAFTQAGRELVEG